MVNFFMTNGAYISAAFSILALIGFTLSMIAFKKAKALQQSLLVIEQSLKREINMVNQGAIGVGRRFSKIEQKVVTLSQSAPVAENDSILMAKSSNEPSPKAFAKIAEQMLNRPTSAPSLSVKLNHQGATKAEQALNAWMNNQQTA